MRRRKTYFFIINQLKLPALTTGSRWAMAWRRSSEAWGNSTFSSLLNWTCNFQKKVNKLEQSFPIFITVCGNICFPMFFQFFAITVIFPSHPTFSHTPWDLGSQSSSHVGGRSCWQSPGFYGAFGIKPFQVHWTTDESRWISSKDTKIPSIHGNLWDYSQLETTAGSSWK